MFIFVSNFFLTWSKSQNKNTMTFVLLKCELNHQEFQCWENSYVPPKQCFGILVRTARAFLFFYRLQMIRHTLRSDNHPRTVCKEWLRGEAELWSCGFRSGISLRTCIWMDRFLWLFGLAFSFPFALKRPSKYSIPEVIVLSTKDPAVGTFGKAIRMEQLWTKASWFYI